MQAVQPLHMKSQRTPIVLHHHSGQSVKRPQLLIGEFIPAQHMKAGVDLDATFAAICDMAVTQGGEIPLQGHQVAHRLHIDDHQITSYAAPRPEIECLGQRAQQPHAVRSTRYHQNNRSITGDAKTPGHAAIKSVAGHTVSSYGPGLHARQTQSQSRRECLHGSEIFSAYTQGTQANTGERG